ncbi:MAG: M3 family oligoendopeptidase [Candidatus Woesearchaeota archaeon]
MADGDVWNVDDVLLGRSVEGLEQECKDKTERFKRWREKLSDDVTPAELREALLLKQDLAVLMEGLQDYYGLQFTTNTQDQELLGRMTYVDQLSTDLGNEVMFFDLWFMHLPDGKAEELIKSGELEDFKYYLEEVRKLKPYTKSEEVERIISLKGMTGRGAFSSLYDVFTSDFTYELDGKKLTQEEVKQYVFSTDPEKREEAYKELLRPYRAHETVLSEVYKNIVLDWNNEGLKIRGYESPIGVRNHANDIDREAVDALLETIRENVGLFKDYFKLRHDLHRKRGQTYAYNRYHVYAPFDESEKTYSYDETKELVLGTFNRFDKRFHDAAKSVFDAGHVHSHPKKGKRPGAFCSYLGGLVKPYVLLNHTGKLRDVFTMMHELGHAVHGVFAEKQQPLLHHAALPMAETASIFAEMLLAERFLSEASDEEKVSLLVHQLDNQWASITRQAYFVLFEQEAHEMVKRGATKDELKEKYMGLLEEQFGDMEVPEEFRNEWNYIPHIHATPFYCYAYAWGNLLVLALYDQYRKEGGPFVEKYVKLLSAGGSKRPQDLLRELGMDPAKKEFWQRGFDVIKEEVERLKELESA